MSDEFIELRCEFFGDNGENTNISHRHYFPFHFIAMT